MARSDRGVVGGSSAARHAKAGAARDELLNPPCPHAKLKSEGARTICAHCGKAMKRRSRADIERDIEDARAVFEAAEAKFKAELAALPKATAKAE